MEDTSEFLSCEITLTERIMILEELEETNTVLLHDLLNLDHEGMMIRLAIEISKSVAESRLGTGSVTVDHILEAVGITEEVSIPDRVVLVAIDKSHSVDLLFANLEAESVEDLSEDLGADLEVTESVSILEEALSVKSILSDHFTEVLDDLLAELSLSRISLTSSIDSLCANITDGHIKVLLEALLGEDFVNSVREISPLDVLTFLGGLEDTLEHLKLLLGDGAFGHVETDSKLLSSDKAGSESIEITEELRDTDSLLLAEHTDASDDIVLIIWLIAHNLGLADTCLGLGEVVGAVVEALVDTEKLFSTIDIFTEVNVVALIDVTLVHVAAEERLEDVLRSADSQKVEDTKELILGDMTVASDIVVLEDWFQMDALVLDGSLVFLENLVDLGIVLIASQVLAAGEESVASGHAWDACRGGLVDSGSGEGAVHVGAEFSVSEESLRIISLVLLGERLELVVGQGEVHGAENSFELWASDAAFSELVEIAEELFNTDSLHYDGGLETILNIRGII